MPAPYSAGSIFLQVLPSFRGVPEQIAREAREWGEAAGKDFDEKFEQHAAEAGKKVGKKVGKAVSDEVAAAGKTAAERFSDIFERDTRAKALFRGVEAEADQAGKKAGDAYAGRFATAVKSAAQRAAREVATIKVDVNDKAAVTKLRALNRDLAVLQDAKREIGMDVNVGSIMEKFAKVENTLRDLQDSAGSIDMRVNSATALNEVARVRGELMALSSIQIEPELKIDRQMGAFERGVRGAIEGALRDLGTVDVGVSSSAGQRAVADIRERLFSLGDMQIGIDISAETFREKLQSLRDELEQLQREHWSVDLDANTAAASAALTGILTSLEAVDGRHADIDIDVRDAVSAITTLKGVEAAAGSTGSAIQRLTGNTNEGANAFRAFNARILGVAALAPLVVPALGAIGAGIAALGPLAAVGAVGLAVLTLGLFGVGDAFKAMGEARTNSAADMQDYARGVRSAANGVAEAERSVADARESAARSTEAAGRQVQSALRGVEDAQRSYQQALEDEESAQRDLQRAREDAAEQLEDLQLRVRDGALDQRQATLDLREAERELAEARADGVAGDDLEQLILNLDKARLRIDQTKESNQDLTAEQAKWAKTGIEGSDTVVAAHERVQQAQERIADAERGMADAQRALGDARAAQTRAAVDGQKQITDAQRRLSEAQLAYSEATLKTSTSQEKLNEEMAKLGPAGQAFVRFLDGLRPRFQMLRSIAQGGLLPGLTEWIDSMVNYHGPLLESTVGNISGAIGRMFAAFGQSIRGQAFTDLFQMINDSGPSFIRQMSDILVNLGEGVAHLIVAVEPLSRLFGEWLVNATARFSEWASNLRDSTGLQEFFGWVQRVGPKVANFLWEFADALIAIGRAIAPFAERMVENFTSFFDWISELDPAVLGPLVIGIAALTVALQAIFGLTALIHSFRSALHLTTGALGAFSSGAGGLKGAGGGIAILVGSLATLYTQSEAVRNIINDVVGAIGDFVGWVTRAIPSLVTLASTLAIVAASWKAAQVIGGGIGRIGSAATNAAPGLGVFVSKLSGSDKAGSGAMTTMGKLGGALTQLGRILPVIGLGFGIVGGIMEYNAKKTEEARREIYSWMEAASQGGSKADEAGKRLVEYRDRVDGLRESLKEQAELLNTTSGEDIGAAQGITLTSEKIKELEANLESATKEWETYWNSLTPVEQAQAGVTAAQRDLQAVLKDYPPSSEEARDAANDLAAAERSLAALEGSLAIAISGVNTELLKRQGIAIGVAEAQMAYQQSVGALNDAHQRYLDTLADPEATEEQSRQALEAWHNQALSTAKAAQSLVQAKYADADANVRQQMGNAALLNDLNRQKALFGELPPELEKLRLELEQTIPKPFQIAAGFEALGLSILATPNEHTIIIESATAEEIAKMEALGLRVTELPDGSFKVEAVTDDAKKALDELTAPRTISITAQIDTAANARRIDAARRAGTTPDGTWGRGGYATGGPIWGPGTGTSDSILARLSNGEYVVKAASVNKYGLSFMEAVNSGRFEPPPAFARGGRVRGGLPAFADGGYVASYGGTINLSGAAVPELASWWVAALSTITQASSQAAMHISTAFSQLRAALLGNFSDTHIRATGIWGTMLGALIGRTSEARTGIGSIFGNLRDLVLGRTRETRDGSHGYFSSLRDWISARATEMRDRAVGRVSELASRVLGHFSGMPKSIAGPVNRLIDGVLNNGLFKAFNSVVGALGLDSKLKIPTATKVKLAMGGRVPGYSPHARADNIPAMLTAGEWVQPVDSVQHYGPEVMEAIRKKRIPREVFAPIYRASGGLVALGQRFQSMGARVSEHPAFGGVTGVHVRGSQHYLGNAIDVNTRPGTSALEQRELDPMAALARSLGFRVLWKVKDHFNHLHVDGSGNGSLIGSVASGTMGLLSDPIGMLRKAVDSALGTAFDGSPATRIMRDSARKLVGFMADKVTGWAGSLFDFGLGDGSFTGYAKSTNSANEQLVQQMAAARGWTGSEWSALRTLIMKESGFNNTAQNPTSSAYGMFQFLNGTWGGTGIGKTADPRLQTEAGFKYISSRYGTPSRALAFHLRNNWYSEGGEVRPNQAVDSATGGIVPDLHDTGGWVMPGLNVLMNRTNRPEPVINPQTLDSLISIADRGGAGAALIGEYHQQVVSGSPRDAVDELLHQLDAASLGGRYEGRG